MMKLAVVGGLLMSVSVLSNVHAANVAWSGAQNISGASDVSTTGTLLAADNFGATGVAGVAVNTVPFAAFPVAGQQLTVTNGPVTLSGIGGSVMGDNSLGGSTATPFTNLNSNYQTLLTSLVLLQPNEGTGQKSEQITVTGLTPGYTYLAQIFANISSLANNDVVSIANGPDLTTNTTDATGGVGQYSTGTFVADQTTQSFTLSGTAGDVFGFGPLAVVNAFQIRTTAVPEPASLALVLAGLAAISRRRRA